MIGPLEPQEGMEPRFAQLYINDPQLENAQRFEAMSLPSGMSAGNKQKIKQVLEKVQEDLHEYNPYVQDFLQIKELPEEQLQQGNIVISAKHRSEGEHVRRYNQQLNLNEVSILTNIEPHDQVLHR